MPPGQGLEETDDRRVILSSVVQDFPSLAVRAPVTDPLTESFTTEALRLALTQVEAEPVRLSPVLGRIVFGG